MEVDLEHAAVADVRCPEIGDIEVELAGIVVGVAARCKRNILDAGGRIVDLVAVTGQDVEDLQNCAAAVDEPDIRAEEAADIEDVVSGGIGKHIWVLDS